MAAFTREIFIDVVNETLSPSWQLRNAAAYSLHEVAQFSPELVTSLQWGDIVAHQPPTELVLEIPDVRALRLPPEAVPAFSAWATFAAERGWRANPDNLIFPAIRDDQYRLDEPLGLEHVQGRWEADDVAEPTRRDVRDVAALCLGRVRGSRGVHPATVAQLKWYDLHETDFRWGNEVHLLRTSLFEVLGDWGEVWEEIVGREIVHGDPILIPTDAGRLQWEDDSKATRPKPLSLAAYYRIFRKRGAMAGYPWLCATDCTAKPDDDGLYTMERAY